MKKIYKGLIALAAVFLLTIFGGARLLEVLITYPGSPYYVDFKDPDPLYETEAEIHTLENGNFVIGLNERNIEYHSLEELPPELIDAFIAIEDNRFYRHRGYDIKGIARAFWVNLTHREVRQGGSTITQQLARNLFLGHDQTLTRKILEFSLAVQIEDRFTKDEIMEMYLNQVYFGNGNWGVEQAAQDYFDKPATELDLTESSMIAGLVQAPSYYAPVTSWEPAANRQKIVLKRMVELELITEREAREALFNEEIIINFPRDILNLALEKLNVDKCSEHQRPNYYSV
ncbi:glycosyl transferase family 51 [Natranaerobius thermophilus JW/NM-WN-LF]|uniref:Penicillin-binding protein 1A n=1 Tax=Natranaerobius thermophilus (strain ATCC BAA-1301 / DSM 18059 / JW/NM-WN-LF) TaxID=457570 RepID=B2A709_NATTJ|nr:glycosyl transferase family 51 [Natranaerobius thermophilus JW/NM-WN-LF]